MGSGPSNLMPGWWNVDIRPFPGVDEVLDATKRWPWSNLEFVYGEHFLEHLPPDGAMHFLREAARALRPGGTIRLSTPGLEHVWVTHFDASAGRPSQAVIADTYRANRAFHGWGHQFLYSRPMLERALRASGFADLSFHDYGASDISELRDIERHGGWAIVDGWPSVWIVEAVRTTDNPAEDELLAAEIEMEFVRHVRSGH